MNTLVSAKGLPHGELAAYQQEVTARFVALSAAEILRQPRAAWIVNELIPAQGVGIMVGEPGAGKSALMLDLAITLCEGGRWFERRVRRCAVVYVAAEGRLRDRLAAVMKERDLSDVPGFVAIESGIDLREGSDTLELIDAIKLRGLNPGLIIIDTLNRAMPGGNENGSEDMGKVLDAAKTLVDELDCVVCFVHHPGKANDKGARGHSSLVGNVDFEILVKRSGDFREIYVNKQRDAVDQYTLAHYKLFEVVLGSKSEYDEYAEPDEMYSSVVVRAADASTPKGSVLSRQQTMALKYLHEAFDEGAQVLPAGVDWPRKHGPQPGQTVCPEVAWKKRVRLGGGLSESNGPDAERKAFNRSKDKLISQGFIGLCDGWVWLRT